MDRRGSGGLGLTVARSSARRFLWLAFPAALLTLGVLLGLSARGRQSRPLDRLDEAHLLGDAKLHRTLTGWRGADGLARPLGHGGLAIELLLPVREWADMRKRELVDGFRQGRREARLRFDGGPEILATYRIRGGQSLDDAFRQHTPQRLNFSIRLSRRLPFAAGIELRRFFLQNQVDDRHMFHMRTAYLLLQEMGLFDCYNQFVSLAVNGRTVGAYLLVERPESAIRRVHPDVLLIARRARPGGAAFEELYRGPTAARDAHLQRLEQALRELEGAAAAAEVERLLDLDGYLRWLAFNSFVRNADSFDEIFFYVVPSPRHPGGELRVMGWDYDDLRAGRPAHPRRTLADPLLFGAEDELDRLVQSRPRLYGRFQWLYRRLLEESLTESHIREVMSRVEAELGPVDTGLPPHEDQRFRRRRAWAMRDFATWLLERRRSLLDELPGGAAPP